MKVLFTLLIFIFTNLAGHAAIRIASLNLRNFGHEQGRDYQRLLKNELLKTNADIFAFQEIIDGSRLAEILSDTHPNHQLVFSRCGGGGRQHLAMAYPASLFDLVEIEENESVGNSFRKYCGSLRPSFIVSLLEKSTQRVLSFHIVHLKAGGDRRSIDRRNNQYRKLAQEISAPSPRFHILLGDFNTTGFDQMDQDGRNFFNFLQQNNLTTSATATKCTSYWPGRNYKDRLEEPSTLDHIVVSNQLKIVRGSIQTYGHCLVKNCEQVNKSQLGSYYKAVSDHCPLALTIE